MPNNPKPEGTPCSIAFYVILGAALFAFVQSFSLLSPILLSFLLVFLIFLAVNPVIFRIRVLTGGRKSSTALVLGAVVVILALTGWALFGPMRDSVTNLSEQLPVYWERLQKPLIRMEQQAIVSEEKLQTEVSTEIARTRLATGKSEAVKRTPGPAPVNSSEDSGSLRSSLTGMLQNVVAGFTSVAFNGAQILVVLLTVFFGVSFTLMNPHPILGAMFSLLPECHHKQTLVIMQRIGKFVPAWAGATLLGMLIIGLMVFLTMCPIFGFMDALVLGLIAGILEVVPFLGPILSAVPAILLALGKGGMTPLWILLAYTAIQALENNLIQPIVMARGMKLHPLAVIFSMLLCVAGFGVLGVLVAAPLVAIVHIFHDELYRKRFLPATTDADLNSLAKSALHEI